MFRRLIQTENDWGALFARLALGVVMFPHGAQTLLGWWGGMGFSKTVGGFQSHGMPAILAILVIVAESFGSLGLILGFLSRVAGAGIGTVMVGAIFLGHLHNGFFMNWLGTKQGEGYEYHLLAIGLALVILIKGRGALSVDRAISTRR